ncbi:hypothetical protein [Streptomyces sp. NPDC015414]|uniref:hypothetical protein n=1 Tax=Streptomyces sp. NPDC015414 TaxID=3364957 RepID=UPI0036F6115F
MTFDEIPLEACGATVQEVDAHLYRERWADGNPVRVQVTGTIVSGGYSSRGGFTLDSREELGRLISMLQGAYHGWPADHR